MLRANRLTLQRGAFLAVTALLVGVRAEAQEQPPPQYVPPPAQQAPPQYAPPPAQQPPPQYAPPPAQQPPPQYAPPPAQQPPPQYAPPPAQYAPPPAQQAPAYAPPPQVTQPATPPPTGAQPRAPTTAQPVIPPQGQPQFTPPPPPGPPPPPLGYPPGPPVYYYRYPPPPIYYRPPPPPSDGKVHLTLRASGGVSFISSGYYCGYYYYYYVPGYGCGNGFATAQPDINLDLDIWADPNIGLTFGGNVMWGNFTPTLVGVPPNSIYSKTWEPHIDLLLSPGNGSSAAKGRIRLGAGLYVAEASGLNTTGQTVRWNGVGGAFRMGFGVSLAPKSPIGVGLDAIFEAGWIGSNYVSTIQLLIGPELHF